MLDTALKLLREFSSHSYKAYIVGGFVRDYILGIKSNDIDITTDAKPKEIKEIFEDSCLPNDDYGSVTVISKGIRFEITTFREEKEYEDHRRPSVIQYIDDLYPDLLRRDFVINTLCMDEEGKIIDYLGGQKDIEDRIIRTVGDAKEKFSDDSLRILRAIRFATILDFQLSDEIEQAIFETKGFVRELSYQRKKEEVEKIFNSPNRDKGIQLLLKFGLDQELEIEHLEDVIGRDMDSSLVVWSQLEVSPKYPFHKNEMEMIHHIQKAMELNNLDPMALYTYGLYVNSCAGKMKDVDVKKITESYANLVIKSRDEIAITSLQIMELLHRGSGKYLKEIYDDSISQYIVEHYA